MSFLFESDKELEQEIQQLVADKEPLRPPTIYELFKEYRERDFEYDISPHPYTKPDIEIRWSRV